jgi:hypothetical protein
MCRWGRMPKAGGKEKLVSKGLPRKEVEKARRMLMEYGLSEWDMTYILIKDRELHERVKGKENG